MRALSLKAGVVGVLAATALLACAGQSESRPFVPDTKCENETLASATSKPDFKPGGDLLVQGTCTVGEGSYDLGTMTIANGVLQFDDATINIRAKAIVIEQAGSLIAGSTTAPFGKTGKLTITFVGPRPDTCPLPFTGSLDAHADWCGKGLVVGHGGTLQLVGAKGVPSTGGVSWTHLRDAAGKKVDDAKVEGTGASTLHLAKDVTQGDGAWKEKDWIAVATTSFSPFETEFVQIKSLKAEGGGTTIGLEQALKYYHFGSADPGPPSSDNFRADKTKNYGVDERAEVGLISRSIKLTAEIDASHPHWGGEVKILHGFAAVTLQGVELEKFGKARFGSYPIHLHEADAVATPLTINANSVHHSLNKCIALHGTSKVLVQHNVCARIVGHIFYQEIGTETDIVFDTNVGMGAMSNSFDIHEPPSTPTQPNKMTRAEMIKEYWWAGDNLARSTGYNYDGLKVYNTDRQDNPTHGSCYEPNNTGELFRRRSPVTKVATPQGTVVKFVRCEVQEGNPDLPSGQVYIEAASGFWIVNPGTKLTNNSIAGCQGHGKGYWYVPPTDALTPDFVGLGVETLKFQQIGEFKNNRVHGCDAGVYGEPEDSVVAEQLFPHVGGTQAGKPIILTLDGFTATRNRARGIWLRPTWIVVKNARLATNRENVTLVTSGGLDGNEPGVWQLLTNSVVVGISQNNVDRFGPCPGGDFIGNPSSGKNGCIDVTFNEKREPTGDAIGRGYADPTKNFFGYMLYDGPVLVFNDRFVNFNVDLKQHLTKPDKDFLDNFAKGRTIPSQPPSTNAFVYEGDAAFGWFQSNQSSYPTATSSRGLVFDNVDLRHQIYTEGVNIADFNDGDKNTAILDLDGTLTGLIIVDKDGKRIVEDQNGNLVPAAFPASLNNLPLHHYGDRQGGSVDECLAEGKQNELYEGRPTSLISPGSIATLQLGALWPPFPDPTLKPEVQALGPYWQDIHVTRDTVEFSGTHPAMTLQSRNLLGVWEPKVTHGYGYTFGAATSTKPGFPGEAPGADPKFSRPIPGMPTVVDVGVLDAVKPDLSSEEEPYGKDNPFFHVRAGLCYTDQAGKFPQSGDLFTITRGYRSYGGGGTNAADADLQQYWNKLDGRKPGQKCHNLNQQNRDNQCPAEGVTAVPASGGCPAPSVKETWKAGSPPVDVHACVYPRTQLRRVDSIAELTKKKLKDEDPDVPDLDVYFYDKDRGLLFFHVAQETPNAFGPSPLGSCPGTGGDASCQFKIVNGHVEGESYYPCPAQGCTTYVVKLNDQTYTPGASKCEPYRDDPNAKPPAVRSYAQSQPEQTLFLAGLDGKLIGRNFDGGVDQKFPHYKAQPAPVCPKTTP